MKNGDKFPLF